MKIFNLGVYELKYIEKRLDEMMKRAPVGFLFILGIKYMILSVFSFSVILKPRRSVYSVLSFIISSQLLLAL